MAEIKGNIAGLKPNQKKNLLRLFQKRVSRDCLISWELGRQLTEMSLDIGRQIGILIDRKGNVLQVFVGDSKSIMISELGRFRVGRSRFRGVRWIHTHLNQEPLSQDDLTDLALLRFDAVAALETLSSGLPGHIYVAWLQPGEKEPWHLEEPVPLNLFKLDFYGLINVLEQEYARRIDSRAADHKIRKAVLVGVTTNKLDDLQRSMTELTELAASADIEVVDIVTQKRQKLDAKFVVGSGKLTDIMVTAMQKGVDLIVFAGELSGSQMRAISELCEIEVIDRTQLILDIFARRAGSRDGKLQVELAQMKYSLPRLVLKDDFMSRITGGIGAKGPGETKIEVLRRRVKDRIAKLEHELEKLSQQRRIRRQKRQLSQTPIINLVGYTNAGKSTILRTLTGAEILVEDRLFATLDPTSRRLRLPSGRRTVLIDTVGFIQDLPEDLAKAFRATLEELRDADILLHIVDISNPEFANQIMAVQQILEELALDDIPQLVVFNKIDKTAPEILENVREIWTDAVFVSALESGSLKMMLDKLDELINSWSIGNIENGSGQKND
ncbi:MAG: GTPase HflX [Candidatus Bruticola sp.]